jgi:hypothetical protein
VEQGHLTVADESSRLTTSATILAIHFRRRAGRREADRQILRSMLPDLRINVEAMIAEGDFVVSRYTAIGPTPLVLWHAADREDRANAGDPDLPVFQRKIVESWAARDDLGTLRQLGS